MDKFEKETILYYYKFRLSHITSTISIMPKLKYINDNYIKSGDNVVLGKPYGVGLTQYFKQRDDINIYLHFELFVLLGASLGLSWKNPNKTWLIIGDSNFLNGLFHELMLNLNENHNLHIIADYNNFSRSAKISNYFNPEKMGDCYKIPVNIIDDIEKEKFDTTPSLHLIKTDKATNYDVFKDPFKNHGGKIDEKVLVQLFKRK